MTDDAKSALHNQKAFSDMLKHIQQSRQTVFSHINTALIELYWHIGQIISHKVSTHAWGKGVPRSHAPAWERIRSVTNG